MAAYPKRAEIAQLGSVQREELGYSTGNLGIASLEIWIWGAKELMACSLVYLKGEDLCCCHLLKGNLNKAYMD